MAHVMDWGVLSTISTRNGTLAAPFGNPYSFVDGGCGADGSTGTIYFYASGMDQSMIDIEVRGGYVRGAARSEAAYNGGSHRSSLSLLRRCRFLAANTILTS